MRTPKPPSGHPNAVSVQDMDAVTRRLYASVGMEQEITLSPWECWLLLRLMERLEYSARRR